MTLKPTTMFLFSLTKGENTKNQKSKRPTGSNCPLKQRHLTEAYCLLNIWQNYERKSELHIIKVLKVLESNWQACFQVVGNTCINISFWALIHIISNTNFTIKVQTLSFHQEVVVSLVGCTSAFYYKYYPTFSNVSCIWFIL